MSKDKAVVIYSGGQDSTTCLFWAIKLFRKVWAIGFNYGQRHVNELKAAEIIAKESQIPYKIFKINTLHEISENSLTNTNVEIDSKSETDQPPNTLVEGRNLLFLTYAGIYAKQLGVDNLVMGVGQTDYSGYPDCRDEFIQSAKTTLHRAFDYEFSIHTPLMWKSKAETWSLANELGVFDLVRLKTVTCYRGIPGPGCCECPACILRAQGLEEYLKNTSK